MFLAAIGRPRSNFDGRVALIPLVEKKVQQKTSCVRQAGEEFEAPITMGKKEFISLMMNKVVPQAVVKARGWARKIVIQMDNAGGHGGARDRTKGTLATLQQWAERQYAGSGIQFLFRSQPARSPDLNALDLGAWTSLNAVTQKVKLEGQYNEGGTQVERLRRRVEEAWEEWGSREKIGAIFQTLELVWKLVVQHEGDNRFLIPHSCQEK